MTTTTSTSIILFLLTLSQSITHTNGHALWQQTVRNSTTNALHTLFTFAEKPGLDQAEPPYMAQKEYDAGLSVFYRDTRYDDFTPLVQLPVFLADAFIVACLPVCNGTDTDGDGGGASYVLEANVKSGVWSEGDNPPFLPVFYTEASVLKEGLAVPSGASANRFRLVMSIVSPDDVQDYDEMKDDDDDFSGDYDDDSGDYYDDSGDYDDDSGDYDDDSDDYDILFTDDDSTHQTSYPQECTSPDFHCILTTVEYDSRPLPSIPVDIYDGVTGDAIDASLETDENGRAFFVVPVDSALERVFAKVKYEIGLGGVTEDGTVYDSIMNIATAVLELGRSGAGGSVGMEDYAIMPSSLVGMRKQNGGAGDNSQEEEKETAKNEKKEDPTTITVMKKSVIQGKEEENDGGTTTIVRNADDAGTEADAEGNIFFISDIQNQTLLLLVCAAAFVGSFVGGLLLGWCCSSSSCCSKKSLSSKRGYTEAPVEQDDDDDDDLHDGDFKIV